MSKIIVAGFFILFSLFTSCRFGEPAKEIDEGTIISDTYTSEEIGWTIKIPKGWTIVNKNMIEENQRKGMEAIEEIAGEVDYSGLKHLVHFQKNPFNLFQSTSEPFEVEYEGEWKDNNESLKELIFQTFANQGISVDTASSQVRIDGLEFEAFHITIFGPNGDTILMQDMYSRLINGFDFGVNINYNNPSDKKTMMDVWKASIFNG